MRMAVCHPEKIEHAKGLCMACYKKKWRSDNKEYYNAQERARHARNPERSHEINRISRQRLKEGMLLHYGSVCKCCGETELEFLEFDHINNDGNVARRGNNRNIAGWRVWQELKNAGFPPVIQTLCANCHRSKTKHGVCIHQRQKMKVVAA